MVAAAPVVEDVAGRVVVAGKAGGRFVEGHIQHGTLIEVCSMLCLDMVRFEHEVSTGQFRDKVILHTRLWCFHLAMEVPA